MSQASAEPQVPPAAVDERQPLLAIVEQDPEEQLDDVDVSPEKKSSWWTYSWYAVLTILVGVALGFFIKGFIDADDVEFDLGKALKSALGGGLSGAAAMLLQVLTLMPLRTVMNYQYRYGTTMTAAINTLYADGGWTRYYQGLTAALIQGPVSRFGDTAANAGILALLQSNSFMRRLPALAKTVFASLAAALFRMILTPVDTVKTTLQTEGKPGLALIRAKIRRYGVGALWYGAWATAAATFVGHYPWFGTYNWLDEVLPPPNTLLEKLLRRAFIGFCASVVSDTISNSLRVVKTYRQVHRARIGYMESARAVIATDGLKGLFGRGLKTRILANGLQGLMFSILWRFFLDLWNEKTK
ncbi:mitochondrial carrier domain-containing protein [Rhodofomes roseus]|uniref:Mitochondrial carrier domain-containing protein n=1 Tax=Rhodofomes roseus TaxID=34475 RepID=A0ABQ8KPA7_9APHY|nr:mitochondrial carrier domain-containing protein [Rhodofomes roseus]KAH9840161.1 mitochondrial carrier domain-containing protein [Rhodofomes roseus]